MKNLGKAWIVTKGTFHSSEKELFAILNPRKSTSYIANYIEQAYVDLYASFDEKISYKKNRNTSPFKIETYMINSTTISHGHEPVFNAYLADKLELKGQTLFYHYKVFHGVRDSKVVKQLVGQVEIS